MDVLVWGRPAELIASPEYRGNDQLAAVAAGSGLADIVEKYTYVWPSQIKDLLQIEPVVWESFRGDGIDLGGGVGCVTSAIVQSPLVSSVLCLELVENAVRLCQPIVFSELDQTQRAKVSSVLGDFDHLEVENATFDFAVMWDSLHHSADPVVTLREARRVLKPGGRLVIIDRVHDDAVPDEEIERMLDVEYSVEFKRSNFMDENQVLTRRMNGEHEWRFQEMRSFIVESGLRIIDMVGFVSDERALGNDFGCPEILQPVDLGGFIKKKFAIVCSR